MPRASAASVPGRSCRCRPPPSTALAAVGRQAGVGDHEAAGVGGPHEVRQEGRHRLGGVGAEEQHRVRRPDVGDGEGEPAVEPEAADPRGGGRAHAPATVVVDLAGAQRHACELAQLVSLLVRQAAAAEHRDSIPAVCRLRPHDGIGHDVEGLVPRRGREVAVPSHERGREAPGRAQQLGARPALLAEATPVRREAARADREVGCRRPGQRHRALEPAVGAVGGDARRLGGRWPTEPARRQRVPGSSGLTVVVIGGSAPWSGWRRRRRRG